MDKALKEEESGDRKANQERTIAPILELAYAVSAERNPFEIVGSELRTN